VLRPNGAAGWGLFAVAVGMSAIAFITISDTVASQFGDIVGMVVLLVVLAYAAAGLSLLLGTPARRPSSGDRLLGIGALIACALLIVSSPLKMVAGAALIALLAWGGFRLFGSRTAPTP
jgi:arginine:agmatine antiporter